MRCSDILSFLFISSLLTSSQAQVPVALRKRLSQISMEEFIDEYLTLPQTDPLANNGSVCGVGEQGQECSSSGRIPPNIKATIMSNAIQPDICSPHLMAVKVPQDPDPDVVRFPTCILIERCAGCGRTEHEICAPVEVQFVPIVIVAANLKLSGINKLEFTTLTDIHMEKHVSCEIRCRIQPEDCNYRIHGKYDEDICRCVCRNAHEESRCILPRRWDEKTCQCLCPTITNCDSRISAFNTDTCRCENRILSSASGLGLHSSADDPTGDTDTAALDMSSVNRLRAMVDGESTEPQSTTADTSTTEEATTTVVTSSTQPPTTTTTPVSTTPQSCNHWQCGQYWEPTLLNNGACGCRPTFDIFSGFPVKKRK